MHPEADIEINGTLLTIGQSITVRVALENFAMFLELEGLGTDEHGKRMKERHVANIERIRQSLYEPNP